MHRAPLSLSTIPLLRGETSQSFLLVFLNECFVSLVPSSLLCDGTWSRLCSPTNDEGRSSPLLTNKRSRKAFPGYYNIVSSPATNEGTHPMYWLSKGMLAYANNTSREVEGLNAEKAFPRFLSPERGLFCYAQEYSCRPYPHAFIPFSPPFVFTPTIFLPLRPPLLVLLSSSSTYLGAIVLLAKSLLIFERLLSRIEFFPVVGEQSKYDGISTRRQFPTTKEFMHELRRHAVAAPMDGFSIVIAIEMRLPS